MYTKSTRKNIKLKETKGTNRTVSCCLLHIFKKQGNSIIIS